MKKKMIKTIAIFAILVLSINMMGGCVLDKTGMVNPSTNLMSGVTVKAELTDQEVVGYLVDQDMRKSINTFSAALFNQTLKDAKGENLLVSPISVLYAMSMCTNGADENTRYELLKALIKGNGNEEITCGTRETPGEGDIYDEMQENLNGYLGAYLKAIEGYEKEQEKPSELHIANSIWMEDGQTLLCSRDYFWRNSLHGFNPHNVDMFAADFDSVDDIVAYIRSMSLYCVERDGQYINFAPTPLADYFASDRIKGEVFDGAGYKTIAFTPEAADLKDLRSFKFEDLTFRGTVEFRSVCEQPVGEIFAASALHVGLMEKLPELTALLAQDRTIYHKGYTAAELRQLFVQKDFPGNIFDRKAVSALILKILDLAKAGLAQRGMDEEDFLAPLYPRAERLESPAVELLNGLARGATIEDYIDKFGRLN